MRSSNCDNCLVNIQGTPRLKIWKGYRVDLDFCTDCSRKVIDDISRHKILPRRLLNQLNKPGTLFDDEEDEGTGIPA